MNRKVRISIEGILNDEKEETITNHIEGEYILFDGKHVLRYKETAGENEEPSSNTLIISPGLVEMSKTGESSTHMVFDMSKDTEAIYDTGYGCLYFQIKTNDIGIEEKSDGLLLFMEYTLSNDGNRISDNSIRITVKEIL